MLPLNVDFMLFSRYNHAITLKVLLICIYDCVTSHYPYNGKMEEVYKYIRCKKGLNINKTLNCDCEGNYGY